MVTDTFEGKTTIKDDIDVIRVLLVDSREAMREGLRQMLMGSDYIKVVGEASNSIEAIAQAQKLSPGIIIMDSGTRDLDGIKLTRSISQSNKEIKVIMLSENPKSLASAIEAGAVGFLTRHINRSQLIAAIRIIKLWHMVLFSDSDEHFALVKL